MRNKKTYQMVTRTVAVLISLALFLVPLGAFAESISNLEDEKDRYEEEAAAARRKAEQKKGEADYLQQQVYQLDAQIAETQRALIVTQQNISSTQETINDLSNQIKTEEDNLAKEKGKLHQVVTSWYMEGDEANILNALIGSDTLSDVITKQEYYDSIKQQITISMDKINELKAELEGQKREQDSKMAELKSLEDEQEGYYYLTQSRKSTKDSLLNYTNQQKKDYLAQIDKLEGQIAQVSSQIYAERQKNKNDEGYITGGSGYPYGAINELDDWGFFTRQCTSYAAWNWNVRRGKSWRNTRPGQGSAYNWPALARDQGYSVSSTPRVGAIISWQATSQWGHVAIVEKVNGDGTIELSEFNWFPYQYTYRTNVNPSNYGSHSYIY